MVKKPLLLVGLAVWLPALVEEEEFDGKGRILLLWPGLLWEVIREAGLAGHVGPDLPTVDFVPEQVRLVGLVEGMTRSGALDSKHIWGSRQRLPPVYPAPNRGTAASQETWQLSVLGRREDQCPALLSCPQGPRGVEGPLGFPLCPEGGPGAGGLGDISTALWRMWMDCLLLGFGWRV